MPKRRGHGAPEAPAAGGDLARLIETEQRIEERLARARDEAERLEGQARASARETETAAERELEQAVETLRATLAAQRDRTLRALADDARRQADAYDRLPAESIAELVAYVVARVIGPGAPDIARTG